MSKKTFDFFEFKDQQKFDQLPQEKKEPIVGAAQDETTKILEPAGKGEKLAVQQEIVLTPEQEKAKKEMIKCLVDGYVDSAIEIKKSFNLPDDVAQSAAKEGMIKCLADGYVGTAIEIKESFNVPENFIQSPEVQAAAKEGMIKRLADGYVGTAIEIKKFFNVTEDVAQSAAKEGIIKCLADGNIDEAIEIKKFFNVTESIIQSTEVQTAAKEEIIKCFANGSSYGAIEIKKFFNVTESIIQSTEVQTAAKEGMIKRLVDGYVGTAIEIKESFNVPEDVAQSAAKEGIIKCLADGYIRSVIEIKESFNVPENFIQSPEVQAAAKEEIIKCFANGSSYGAIEIKKFFNVTESIIQSTEVQTAAKEEIIKCFANGSSYIATEIKKSFNVPEDFIQSTEVQTAAKEGIIKRLVKGYVDTAIEIKEFFNVTESIIQSTEVQTAAKEGIIKRLSNGDSDDALEIQNQFSVNIQPEEIVAAIPKLSELLIKIESIIPGFSEQALRSLSTIFSLCEILNKKEEEFIQTIKESPFLKDALFANARFAVKLIIKYPQFDRLSQENIQTLFEVKKKILANNPEIEPESLEFRQLMQEKLKEYKNNPEILEALKANGVNVDEWLNYSETRYFNLGSESSHLAFSEVIQTPIDRIKETIDSYAHTLKETVKEYRPELSAFKIPLEDPKETEVKISKMQEELEKAKAEGDAKKAQGIERGIEGLKKKIENIKTVAMWDKLLGDIAAFQQLKNDVFGAQEKLTQSEKDLQEKLADKTPSGKIIQELKEKINKAKEELRDKFNILERKIEDFKTNLPGLIAPCLGQERTDSVIQEIEQNLAEQFDHWNTDRRELANLFSEKSDKEKERMANQPMSIFVWARNPDIDLYQGNYTDCCIRIDSKHMGAESTIADYNTDLGIQIVNIWDETKNEPITAAWCWIGQSKNGKAVLVVDNIEAYQDYSNTYPEQLSKELFKYLQNYAKSIDVKKIVLGKTNNDLPTSGALAKMKNDENKYRKLGGYNRINGYFLEAEDEGVKLLWEAEPSPAKDKAKKEKQIKKEEFRDLNMRNLSEKDFSQIKQLERKIYAGTDLISGQAMIEDIKRGNGLEYSVIITGEKSKKSGQEIIGYIAAVEDETDEGNPCIYLEDIAVIPEAQGQGVGWKMLKGFIEKLKEKSRRENKPVLLDMHLRENSQRFMERHRADLERIGVKLLEEALVADYYGEGEDALYQVYQISMNENS